MKLHLKMYNSKTLVFNILVVLFFIHGILYYLNPGSIYNFSNPIKLIKYIIVLAGFCSSLSSDTVQKTFPVFILWCFLGIMHAMSSGMNDFIVLLNYCFPVLTVVLYDSICKRVNLWKCLWTIYYLTSIMGYLEYFVMDFPFQQYADMGYRVCSVFINPNNFSSFLWISTIIFLCSKEKILKKLCLLVNSMLLMILSGSRTGMLVMAIGIFLIAGYLLSKFLQKQCRVNKKRLIQWIGISGGILFFSIIMFFRYRNILANLFSGSRKISEISLSLGRFEQFRRFLDVVREEWLFPGELEYVYTDNLYFHIWGFFGLFVLILFIAFIMVIFYVAIFQKNRICLLLLILFSVYGLAENYLYLWPGAYVFWFIASYVLRKDKRNFEESGKTKKL